MQHGSYVSPMQCKSDPWHNFNGGNIIILCWNREPAQVDSGFACRMGDDHALFCSNLLKKRQVYLGHDHTFHTKP